LLATVAAGRTRWWRPCRRPSRAWRWWAWGGTPAQD